MFRSVSKISTKLPTSSVITTVSRAVSFGKAAKIEAPAPKFESMAAMPDLSLKKISLDDYKGKYVVLAWYPKDFTFGT